MSAILCRLILPATVLFAAAPAQAALPRLTGGLSDYLLMPLLGYFSLVAGAWCLSGIGRLLRSRG